MTASKLSYESIRPLGSGSTGHVELCRLTLPFGDLSAGSEVAIKTLSPDRCSDEHARAAFRAEAKAGSRVKDPSLVHILAHGVADGRPYLVMQYVPGRSLREILAEDGALPEPIVRGLASQLAGALAVLHAAGMVHGDVKPENVRMDDDGRAVLLDLGFARGVTSTDLRQTGAGSLAYLSPERARGEGPSPEADVFALGVVLYELCTGVHPFGYASHPGAGRTPASLAGLGSSSGELLRRSIEIPGADDLLAAISTARIVLPSHFAPQLSPFLDRGLADALLRAPERRPSAAELRDRFTDGEAGGWWRSVLRPESHSEQPTQRKGSHLTPLVGRKAELATLERCLAATGRLEHSRPHVIWLSGPEGSGKWRLVNDFAAQSRESSDRPPLYLYARWTDSAEAQPAGSLSILLHRWLQLPLGTRPGEREAGLLRELVVPRAARTLLLALDREEQYATDESVSAALAEWLVALGQRGQVIVFLDDLHRSGSETLAALSVLIDALTGSAVLLVLGVREDEPPRRPVAFEALRDQFERLARTAAAADAGGPVPIHMELGPITEADIFELVQALFDRSAPHLQLARVLWLRSRGNAGLVSEILRDLVRRGEAHARSEDNPSLVLTIEPDDLPMPRSLARIIAERVRALDPGDRRWLERLAVVGGHIAPGFLVSAFPPTPAAEIDGVLGRLVRQDWLVPAAARYRFARPALREAIYLSLTADRRQRLHLAAAKGLAAGAGSVEERFQRAFHLRQAEQDEELLEVVLALTSELRRHLSAQRLLTLARWGLEALERLQSSSSASVHKLELLEVAGDAADRLGNREEERVLLDHMADLELEPESYPKEAARLYLLHARYAAGTGQLGLARGMLRNATQLAESAGDPHLISESTRRLALVQAQIGEIDEARRLSERALATAANANQEALGHLSLAMTEILEDRVEEAVSSIDQAIGALRHAAEVRLGVVAHAHMLRGRVWRSAGRPVRALRATSRAVRLAQRSGERRLEAEARARYGGLLLDLDRPEEAEVQLRDALRVADKIEDRRGAVLASFGLGVLLWENDDSQAFATIRRATDLAHEIGFARAEAVCLAIQARVHVEQGAMDQADRDSASAVELLDRHGAELVDRITIAGTRAYVLNAIGRPGDGKVLIRRLRRLMRRKNARLKDPILRTKQRAYSTRLLETVLSADGPVYPRTFFRQR